MQAELSNLAAAAKVLQAELALMAAGAAYAPAVIDSLEAYLREAQEDRLCDDERGFNSWLQAAGGFV